MKATIFLVLFVCSFVVGYQEIFSRDTETCRLWYEDVKQDYLISLFEFAFEVWKDVGPRSLYHFTFSPLSVWIILAAMAEGADPHTQQQLFRLLRLPNDPCTRLNYYKLATSRYQPGNDVSIVSKRTLVINEGVSVNPYWHNFVLKNRLIDLARTPLRYDPQGALNAIRLLSTATLANLDLSGNSVLVDTVDYNGLWATAFSDAVIQRSPFYDSSGRKIGSVDLMRVTRHAKISYISSLKFKVLEFPIGVDNRYVMLLGITVDNSDVDTIVRSVSSSVIQEIMRTSYQSHVPLNIAIPRFTMTSEINVRRVLEHLDVTSLWTDPAVTRNMSDPAMMPSSYVQRTTITLNHHGISRAPYLPATDSALTGLEPDLGKDFIANKPFIFRLFDTETVTCLIASIYSQPTFNY